MSNSLSCEKRQGLRLRGGDVHPALCASWTDDFVTVGCIRRMNRGESADLCINMPTVLHCPGLYVLYRRAPVNFTYCIVNQSKVSISKNVLLFLNFITFRGGIHLYAAATERTSSALSCVQTSAALNELPDFKISLTRTLFSTVLKCLSLAKVHWQLQIFRYQVALNTLSPLLSSGRHKFARWRWHTFCFPIDSISN